MSRFPSVAVAPGFTAEPALTTEIEAAGGVLSLSIAIFLVTVEAFPTLSVTFRISPAAPLGYDIESKVARSPEETPDEEEARGKEEDLLTTDDTEGHGRGNFCQRMTRIEKNWKNYYPASGFALRLRPDRKTQRHQECQNRIAVNPDSADSAFPAKVSCHGRINYFYLRNSSVSRANSAF